MLGDSMFSNGAVKDHLEELADGKLKIEQSAVVGASFHEGWVPSIPALYSYMSIRGNPPITAIVDGGGNDVMSVKVKKEGSMDGWEWGRVACSIG